MELPIKNSFPRKSQLTKLQFKSAVSGAARLNLKVYSKSSRRLMGWIVGVRLGDDSVICC